MDVLQGCSEAEMRDAWSDYQRYGPRTQAGKLCRPDPGALYLTIMRARPKPRLMVNEPDRGPSITGDEAHAILKQAGCRVSDSGRVLSLGNPDKTHEGTA
jgi:hypothetical protein